MKRAEAGRWSLGRGGELSFRRDGRDESASMKARVTGAGADALFVRVTSSQSDQTPVGRELRLSGAWTVDAKNRLVFSVERRSGRSEALVFDQAWEIGKDLSLRAKLGRERAIALEGSWDAPGPGALVYTLENGAALRFRAALQTPSVLAKAGELRWQIGVEARRGRVTRELALFGKWRLKRDLSLEFEARQGRRRRALAFGAAYRLGEKNRVSVGLEAADGRPLGGEVVFTREMRGPNAEAFVRLQKDARESLAEAGLKFLW